MKNPTIKNKTYTTDTVELLLNFAKDAEYFDGHFDGFAVLPGVVQIDYVMKYAQEYLGIKPIISNINKLKFSNIIKPDMDISLKIDYSKDLNKITFKYFIDDSIYSSGNIKLK